MKILYLTLKGEWFNMVRCGEKREEYREIKPYWDIRFKDFEYDVIEFRNGYRRESPVIRIELLGIERGIGRVEWGAPEGEEVYILKLGEIIRSDNLSNSECPECGKNSLKKGVMQENDSKIGIEICTNNQCDYWDSY